MVDYDAIAASVGGAAAPQAKVQVFTGIISAGVLGAPQDFAPTKSDLIQSMDDLETEAHKNAADFLVSLPGHLRYSIKFGTSFKNPDGSVDQATTQQVVSGYTKKNVPKYKTVKNKFAIMTISLVGDQGQIHKVKEINLGPVDAATVTPTQFQLNGLNTNIQTNIITTDTGDFHTLVSPTPTDVVNTPPAPAPTPAEQVAIQNEINANASIGRPAVQVISTTYQEALNNLVPVRFMLGQVANGLPEDILYVGASPNILYGTTEITLQAAQDLIRNTPPERRVGKGGNPALNAQVNYLQLPGTTTPVPYRFLLLEALGGFTGTFDDILSGRIPASEFVAAFRSSTGEVLTFVPLSTIQKLAAK